MFISEIAPLAFDERQRRENGIGLCRREYRRWSGEGDGFVIDCKLLSIFSDGKQ
jgi:hypothetical protein